MIVSPDVSGTVAVFLGIGGFIVMFSYFLFQLVRFYKMCADLEEEYSEHEIGALRLFARKKIPDINKEILKWKVESTMGKSFRRRMGQEMIKEYFDKEKK